MPRPGRTGIDDGLGVRGIRGKVCVVTGGLSGIGKAIAERFVEEGARVVAADITSDSKQLQGDEPSPFHVDVADPQSVDVLVRNVIERYGRLDFAINSAGLAEEKPFLQTTLTSFDRIMAVNVRGTFLVSQACAKVMPEEGGCIVNIASVSGVVGNLGRSSYGASKGAIITLSRVMAIDLASRGIRVNAVAPGPIDTPLAQRVHTAATRAKWLQSVPMRRYGRPEEVASASAFLCSEDASYITGHVLAVDGGFLASGLTVGSEE